MRDFFNMDGPVFSFLSKVADIAILNILFLLCCIPIFTIGASLTGLSYVTLRMREGEDGYIARSFFKSFRQNFKQATVIWLILLVFLIVLILDFQIGRAAGGAWNNAIVMIALVGFVFWLLEMLYVFPILARFENTIIGTMRNGLLVAMSNAPKALLTIVVMAAAVLATLINAYTLSWGILLWLLFGFAVVSYINSALQMKVIHRLMPAEDTEDNPDSWSVPEEPEQAEDTSQKDDFRKYI